MTTPSVTLEEIVPSKAKTWVGLIGSLLAFAGPFILQSTDALPAPWPAIVGLLFAVLAALGIYKAPYKPKGTTLAVDPASADSPAVTEGNTPVAVPASEALPPVPKNDTDYQNPWKKH